MRHAIALAAILFAACSSAPDPLKTADGLLRFDPDAEQLTWERDGKVLLTFPRDAFQVGLVGVIDEQQSYDPYWLDQAPPRDLDWRSPTQIALTEGASGSLAVGLTYDGGAATVTFTATNAGVRAHFVPGAPEAGVVAYLRLRPRVEAKEAFYGLGEWPDHVNHRGRKRPMQLEVDLGMESASGEENHAPIPFVVGTRGWGVFVESRRVGLFDVASQAADLLEITYGTGESSSSGLVFHLFAAAHPLDVTHRYHLVTGAPLLPAPWALGPWLWRDENRDQAQVEDDAAQIRTHDLATSGLWIDRPYASAVNTFDFASGPFPDPAAMIAKLHAAGLRVALWHTPYVEQAAGALRAEAEQKGYFVPQNGIVLNKWSVPVDFTNPAANAWWRGLIGRYTAMGIEGFKLDYAEDVQVGYAGGRNVWKFHDGSDDRTQHYQYQLDYHAAYASQLPATGGFLLCRAARWGDQKSVSVIWPGDMNAGFQRHRDPGAEDGRLFVGGLPATVVQGLSLGASGFPFFGADTGGYLQSPPSREVFVRWFQQTALSSVMQVGNSASDMPWEFNDLNGRDAESLGWYGTYARLHLRLFPYEWTYAQRLAIDGRPIQRALGLAHPELGEHPDDTYLFGDSLLVAPVLEAGRTVREVLLPAGTWVDWWDGTTYAGGKRVSIPAPLSKLPLLLAAGGIVPMLRPTIDTLAPATREDTDSFANDAGLLWIRVAPGPARTEFAVYDGTRLAQQDGGARVDLDTTASTVFTKGTVFEIHRQAAPTSVIDGATALPKVESIDAAAVSGGWSWTDEAGGLLRIRVGSGRRSISVR